MLRRSASRVNAKYVTSIEGSNRRKIGTVEHESLSRRRRRYHAAVGIQNAYAKKLADNLGPEGLLTTPSSSEKGMVSPGEGQRSIGDFEMRFLGVIVSSGGMTVMSKSVQQRSELDRDFSNGLFDT
jgi:hypothetical protein